MIQQMLAIWSLFPLPFSKSSSNIWKFSVHILLKLGLENFENYFASVWDECNCAVECAKNIQIILWLSLGLVWNWPFLVLWELLDFPYSVAYWLQRPVGFDYRTSTWLWKEILGGHKQTWCTLGARRKEQCLHRRLTCLWESRSLQQRCGSTAAC